MEFPRWIYNGEGGRIVLSESEMDCLPGHWYNSPLDILTGKAPIISNIAPQTVVRKNIEEEPAKKQPTVTLTPKKK